MLKNLVHPYALSCGWLAWIMQTNKVCHCPGDTSMPRVRLRVCVCVCKSVAWFETNHIRIILLSVIVSHYLLCKLPVNCDPRNVGMNHRLYWISELWEMVCICTAFIVRWGRQSYNGRRVILVDDKNTTAADNRVRESNRYNNWWVSHRMN